jgi:oxygen-dependent protoporphyrinogen oxidase
MIAPTEWRPIFESRLIGWRTKLRMLAETRRKPFHAGSRTVADFVRDHFGQEALEYLAEPLFAGVYGGNPESLGAAEVLPKFVEYERNYGSLIRGARRDPAPSGPLFESMRKGLGQIPEALAKRLEDRVTFVRAPAEMAEAGRVRVGGDWIDASQIILACGAPASSELLSGTPAGSMLGEIPHSSATIFAFGFRRSSMERPPNGFGFLIPRRERRTIMAGTWVTNKFAGRAPAGIVILRCFVSGDYSDALLPDLRADLKRITGIAAEPLFTRVYRWPNSMPQYGVGHAKFIESVRANLPEGVTIAGAFVNGVGMPDCVKDGAASAGTAAAPGSLT